MKRTKKPPCIPDAINCSPSGNFTVLLNSFLRHPLISLKAKAVLGILLSNKQGWKTHLTQVATNTKEGVGAVTSAVKELEKFGYVIRFSYRDKKSKEWRGMLWAYSHSPNTFDIEHSLVLLDLYGFEIPNMEKKLSRGNTVFGNPAEPDAGNLHIKNTNVIKTTSTSVFEEEDLKKASNGYITTKDFLKFKEIYPVSRMDSEGAAYTKWVALCSNKSLRPTWNRIERAIKKQKQTPRWQDPQFIPLAATWINQKRWLDNPDLMVNFDNNNTPSIEKDRMDKKAHEQELGRLMGFEREIEDDD